MFSKPLILVLLISLSLNLTFGYLSYSFYSDKAVAESHLATAVDANKGLQESLDKKDTACKLADDISTENTSEQKELEESKQELLSKIDSLPSKAAIVVNKTAESSSPKKGLIAPELGTGVADIDDKLPEELKLITQEAYNSLNTTSK